MKGTFLLAILAMGASAVAGASDRRLEGVTPASRSGTEPVHSSFSSLADKSGADVIETRSGTLYYNKANGKGMIAGVNADGEPSFRIDYDFGAGWEKIACVGDSLFFYSADGRAALGYIDSDEHFVRTKSYAAGTFRSFDKALASLESGALLR